MNRKRGLGRGLDALLGGVAMAGPPTPGESLAQLPVERLRRGRYQPRLRMDPEALAELAESIRTQGVVQPIVVRPWEGDYEIIAGERRWRAAQMAGLREVPCLVRQIPDQAAMAIALIENIQREDLNTMEEAGALTRLQREFSLTHEQIAATVGRSRVAVTNLLRLNELEPPVKTLLEQGNLEMGHGRALLGLKGGEQCEAAALVVRRGLTVRQTEALVRRMQQPAGPDKTPDPDLARLEQDLSERLGTPVAIQDRGGKGAVRIEYHSLDQLDGLLALLSKREKEEFRH
ncbi:MAG: ParB/RepB/Spo0J family partition protein [Pseudomonadota bacterium]